MVAGGPFRPAWFYVQSGAVPVRRAGARLEVLLVRSRGRRRWIIPKGIVDPGLSPAEAAAKEAWEEAGARGRIVGEPLGSYRYEKWGGTCTVSVFLLAVEEVGDAWPEMDRERRWVGVEEAASMVDEPELREILLRAGRCAAGGS